MRARAWQWAAVAIAISGGTVGFGAPPPDASLRPAAGWPKLPPDVALAEVSGVALLGDGNLLIFNRGEHPLVEVKPDGTFVRAFGKGEVTRAHGLRVDADGNIWTTDVGAHVVTKRDRQGTVLLTLGTQGQSGDDERHFNQPADVAFGRNGDVFVADGYGNSRVVKFDRAGRFLKAWGRKGTGEGEFNIVHNIVLDSSGLLYVADRENDRIQIFDQGGAFVRMWTGVGAPFGLFMTRDDRLYVADGRAHVLRIVDRQGKVEQTYGGQGAGPGEFQLPHDVAVTGDGVVYVGEITNKRVQKLEPAGAPARVQGNTRVECVAGCGAQTLPGRATDVTLHEPFGVAFDRRGNWYVCEYRGHRISRIDRQGHATAFAGESEGSAAPSGEAGRLTFKLPHGIVITRAQQMFVADTMNHRLIRIDLNTRRAAVVAGTGEPGFGGDGGPASKATFNELYALELAPKGDRLVLVDLKNRRVREMDLRSGGIRTIAGTGESGVPADGARAAESPLVDPRAVTVDSKGRVYILERRGNALRVVDPDGTIRTVIPDGSGMKGPKHLCVDAHDNVLIADSENHVIRLYDPRTRATTIIAGTGTKGSRLAAADPLQTELNRPHGVYVHASGALYISDSENNRVLRVTGWQAVTKPRATAP